MAKFSKTTPIKQLKRALADHLKGFDDKTPAQFLDYLQEQGLEYSKRDKTFELPVHVVSRGGRSYVEKTEQLRDLVIERTAEKDPELLDKKNLRGKTPLNLASDSKNPRVGAEIASKSPKYKKEAEPEVIKQNKQYQEALKKQGDGKPIKKKDGNNVNQKDVIRHNISKKLRINEDFLRTIALDERVEKITIYADKDLLANSKTTTVKIAGPSPSDNSDNSSTEKEPIDPRILQIARKKGLKAIELGIEPTKSDSSFEAREAIRRESKNSIVR